jgi:hypothetical protein
VVTPLPKTKGKRTVRLNKERLRDDARKFIGAGSAYPHRQNLAKLARVIEASYRPSKSVT